MINTDNILQVVTPPPVNIPSEPNADYIKLPFIGRIQCVKDSQGRMLVSGIFAYWVYGTFVSYFIVLVPAIGDDLIPYPNFVFYSFMAVSTLCLLALCRASLTNPGQIPSSSYADSSWNLCKTCNRMRPARAHHCRRCGHCVMRMDHHCPWINNCVGEGNHFAFMQLNVYAFLVSLYALILNLCYFWVFPKCTNCDKNAFHIKHSIWFMYLLFILAVNMVSVMGGMMYQQHTNVILNQTTLETMSKGSPKKGEVRRCYNAYKDLCGQGAPLFWFWPMRRRVSHLPYQLQESV